MIFPIIADAFNNVVNSGFLYLFIGVGTVIIKQFADLRFPCYCKI